MKNLFVLLFLGIYVSMFLACDSSGKKNQKADSAILETDSTKYEAMIPKQICYLWVAGKDSIFLRVEQFPTVTTGNLRYQFFEKDNAVGDIEGKMLGDTLLANYTYVSEGITSVREVAFLLKNNRAYEGSGPQKDEKGRVFFEDLSKVKFDEAKPFLKTDCHTP